jgi:hypothetical protein
LAKDDTMVKLSVTMMWAHLAEPNTKGKFPSGKYEFQATNMSPKAVQALKDIGLKPKLDAEKPEMGYYLKFKNARPFLIKDEDGNVLTKEELATVGNGTKAIIVASAYPYDNKFGKGMIPNALKITITDLKVYTGPEVDDSDMEAF